MRVYYNCVGWPTFLPTNEQESFVSRVYTLKQQQMKQLIQDGAIPLRDGVEQVGSPTLPVSSGAALHNTHQPCTYRVSAGVVPS